MTERPILMNAVSVRGIAAGRKHETRRVMKPQPPEGTGELLELGNGNWACEPWDLDEPEYGIVCPYGKPGDRLWVRESWMLGGRYEDSDHWFVSYDAGPSDIAGILECKRDLAILEEEGQKPSIFMPREFSRFSLIIERVWCQKLHTMGYAAAVREGCPASHHNDVYHMDDRVEPGTLYTSYPYASGLIGPIAWYARLWNAINAEPKFSQSNPWTGEPEDCWVSYPWEALTKEREKAGKPWYVIGNPWVWVVRFKVVVDA